MKTSWSKFRKDKYYLLKYFTIQFIVMSFILSIQLQFVDLESLKTFELNAWYLLGLPFALILGVQIPVLMHNCVHHNLRSPLLNKIMGELAGLYVLLGMAAFEINHTMHHAYSDTELDPHNPDGKNFLTFLFANNFGGTGVVLKKFVQFHGDTFYNRALFNLIIFMHFIAVPMRIAFWLMLLGPSMFIFFFLPSYAFHMFVFAHINFITHETIDEENIKVYNLDSNIYYKLVNFFGSGVYYHHNHHRHPNHYNPKLGASRSWLYR